MTTTDSSTKWPLIGVRVCAVYLLLCAIAALEALVRSASNGIFGWVQLVMIPGTILFGLTAFRLWQLQPWAQGSAVYIFLSHTALGFIGLINPPNWNSSTNLIFSSALVTIGIIGWIFLKRPAVKALFKNRQSAIQNQKS
jgi:hypothetical protein